MYRRAVGLMWRTAIRRPGLLAGALVTMVMSELLSTFLAPLVVAAFFNQVQAGTVTWESARGLLAWYIVLVLCGDVVASRLVTWFTWTFEIDGQRQLHQRVFRHLLSQSMGFHNDRFGGSLVAQATKLVRAFETFWDVTVFELTHVVTAVVAAMTILAFMFWPYAMVLSVLTAMYVTAVWLTGRRLIKQMTAETQAHTTVTGRLADVITNVGTVKSFGREQQESDAYSHQVQQWWLRSKTTMHGYLSASTMYASLVLLMKGTAFVVAIAAVSQQRIQAGTVYVCLVYTMTLTQRLWETSHMMRRINTALSDAYDMTQILTLAPEIKDHADSVDASVDRGAISFDAITFGHQADRPKLFDHFTLHIEPGERVGLVGASGSGKTTLTRLLLRFVDVDSGSIRIDGVDISRMRQTQLRQAISYVPQEPMLFHRSISDNIAYGRQHASPPEIRRAAQQAHAWEFITQLPDSMDTLVGERGVKLSGGQRQRIAIARAILKDAPILVLDEATSALDSESEQLIQDALRHAMFGRTTVVIAHRLSTIRALDRIVVIDSGRIVQQGTHEQLLEQGGTYATLWAHQSGGFVG